MQLGYACDLKNKAVKVNLVLMWIRSSEDIALGIQETGTKF
jgi:hypothetical protein